MKGTRTLIHWNDPWTDRGGCINIANISPNIQVHTFVTSNDEKVYKNVVLRVTWDYQFMFINDIDAVPFRRTRYRTYRAKYWTKNMRIGERKNHQPNRSRFGQDMEDLYSFIQNWLVTGSSDIKVDTWEFIKQDWKVIKAIIVGSIKGPI